MKLFISTLIIALASSATIAQEKQPTPPSTWVIESNLKQPKIQTVKFYDVGSKLIYEEKIEGKKLNVNRRKVREVLDITLLELIKGNTAKEELLATNLRTKKAKL